MVATAQDFSLQMWKIRYPSNYVPEKNRHCTEGWDWRLVISGLNVIFCQKRFGVLPDQSKKYSTIGPPGIAYRELL